MSTQLPVPLYFPKARVFFFFLWTASFPTPQVFCRSISTIPPTQARSVYQYWQLQQLPTKTNKHINPHLLINLLQSTGSETCPHCIPFHSTAKNLSTTKACPKPHHSLFHFETLQSTWNEDQKHDSNVQRTPKGKEDRDRDRQRV
jgi:hypothetical protein